MLQISGFARQPDAQGGLGRLTYGVLQHLGHRGIEGDEKHGGDELRVRQVTADLPDRDRGGARGGVPEHATADRGEGDRLYGVTLGEVE